jgi:hypothetical protein
MTWRQIKGRNWLRFGTKTTTNKVKFMQWGSHTS